MNILEIKNPFPFKHLIVFSTLSLRKENNTKVVDFGQKNTCTSSTKTLSFTPS